MKQRADFSCIFLFLFVCLFLHVLHPAEVRLFTTCSLESYFCLVSWKKKKKQNESILMRHGLINSETVECIFNALAGLLFGGVCPVIVILVRSFVNSKQVIVVTEHWGVYCRSAPPKQNRFKKKRLMVM